MSVKLNYDGKMFTISIPADVAISMLLASTDNPAAAAAIVEWVRPRPSGANWTEIYREFGSRVPRLELRQVVLAAVSRGELVSSRTRGGGHRYRASTALPGPSATVLAERSEILP
jgi:hypothetical protein